MPLLENEIDSLRALPLTIYEMNKAQRDIIDGVSANNQRRMAQHLYLISTGIHRITTGFVLLLGGSPANIGKEDEIERYAKMPRAEAVGMGRAYVDQGKEAIISVREGMKDVTRPSLKLARDERLVRALDTVTHHFQFRLDYADPLPLAHGRPILTLVAEHGHWGDSLNGAFFALKYLNDYAQQWCVMVQRQTSVEHTEDRGLPPLKVAYREHTHTIDAIVEAMSLAAGLTTKGDDDPFNNILWSLRISLMDAIDRYDSTFNALADLAPFVAGAPEYSQMIKKNSDSWKHLNKRKSWKDLVFPNLERLPKELRE